MYADDMYIVIPACNIASREADLDRVADWAQANNLKLNRAKSVEIVFTDCRRKPQFTAPPMLQDIRLLYQSINFNQGAWSHFNQPSVCQRSRPRCHLQVWAIPVCNQSPPLPWNKRRRTQTNLQIRRVSQNDVCNRRPLPFGRYQIILLRGTCTYSKQLAHTSTMSRTRESDVLSVAPHDFICTLIHSSL